MTSQPRRYTPGIFTKNFSWKESYKRLHTTVGVDFGSSTDPVGRDVWRLQSGIRDQDRQLIPINFFLFTVRGVSGDYLMVDQLVDATLDPYGANFAKLALFSFHLSQSGNWRGSIWPDGRVAGWANDLIKTAWSNDEWDPRYFRDQALFEHVSRSIDAVPMTQRKVFTNYRYMLRSAGVLKDEKLLPNDLRQRWLIDAVLLAWDRSIFSEKLPATAGLSQLTDLLIEQEIYKLLRCSKDQCRIFARAAYPEFRDGQAMDRSAQVVDLRSRGLLAA